MASAAATRSPLGLALGALTYFAGDDAIERRGARDRMSPMGADRGRRPTSDSALLLGAVLDGIPESAVIGLSLLGGEASRVPVLAAVFLSNMPEAISSSIGCATRASEPARARVWLTVVTLICGSGGRGRLRLLDGAGDDWVGLIQAFAGEPSSPCSPRR